MRSGKNIAGWVYVMAIARTTIIDIIVGIQYGKITKILYGMNNTNANKEGS